MSANGMLSAGEELWLFQTPSALPVQELLNRTFSLSEVAPFTVAADSLLDSKASAQFEIDATETDLPDLQHLVNIFPAKLGEQSVPLGRYLGKPFQRRVSVRLSTAAATENLTALSAARVAKRGVVSQLGQLKVRQHLIGSVPVKPAQPSTTSAASSSSSSSSSSSKKTTDESSKSSSKKTTDESSKSSSKKTTDESSKSSSKKTTDESSKSSSKKKTDESRSPSKKTTDESRSSKSSSRSKRSKSSEERGKSEKKRRKD